MPLVRGRREVVPRGRACPCLDCARYPRACRFACLFRAIFRARFVSGTDTLASTFFARTPFRARMCPRRAFFLGPQRARVCFPHSCRLVTVTGVAVDMWGGGAPVEWGAVPTHELSLLPGSCSRCSAASAAVAASASPLGKSAVVARSGTVSKSPSTASRTCLLPSIPTPSSFTFYCGRRGGCCGHDRVSLCPCPRVSGLPLPRRSPPRQRFSPRP